MKLRATKTIALSASKAGMSERTARKYLKCGHLPSELKKQRNWRTRENPFVVVWPIVETFLSEHEDINSKIISEKYKCGIDYY